MLFSVIQKFIGYWAALWEDAADPRQVSFLLSVYKFSPKEKQDWWSVLNQNRRTALELTEQYHTTASIPQLQPQLPLLLRLLLAAQVTSKMYNEPTKNHQQTSDDVIDSLSHISMQSIASASDGQTPDLEVSTPTSSPNSINPPSLSNPPSCLADTCKSGEMSPLPDTLTLVTWGNMINPPPSIAFSNRTETVSLLNNQPSESSQAIHERRPNVSDYLNSTWEW